MLEGDNLLDRFGPIDVKKLLKTSAISDAEFIVSLSVLISVILRFVQDLRELSSLISFQVLAFTDMETAPNDSFPLNKLKTLFRLSRVVLDP